MILLILDDDIKREEEENITIEDINMIIINNIKYKVGKKLQLFQYRFISYINRNLLP